MIDEYGLLICLVSGKEHTTSLEDRMLCAGCYLNKECAGPMYAKNMIGVIQYRNSCLI